MEIDKGIDSVLIGGAKAAVVGSTVAKCAISCTPGGPGLVAMGSMTVLIGGQPAARANDPTMHPACAGPVPGLTGKIMPPCCPAVEIA
jgi:uncharacterized Zn-binding protein involved in type VI secretion